MTIGIGLDVGSTTTKIVARRRDGSVVATAKFESGEPGAAAPGVVERFVAAHDINRASLRGIALTGVGAVKAPETILGFRCERAEEFYAIAQGGLLLSGLEKAIVVSMGTGTAIVRAEKGYAARFGGSGVGGGTLAGLARHLYGITDFAEIVALSRKGDLSKVDLKIGDLFHKEYIGLSPELTCSNLGKMDKNVSREDVLLGVVNMIFETAGVMSGMACRGAGVDAVVVTGSLAELPQADGVFERFRETTGLKFIVPEGVRYATALGAAGALWDGARSARLRR